MVLVRGVRCSNEYWGVTKEGHEALAIPRNYLVAAVARCFDRRHRINRVLTIRLKNDPAARVPSDRNILNFRTQHYPLGCLSRFELLRRTSKAIPFARRFRDYQPTSGIHRDGVYHTMSYGINKYQCQSMNNGSSMQRF